MDIVSNSPYDVRAQYGHLIIVCLDSDEQKCQTLRNELSEAGYAYLFFPISRDTLSRRDYLSEVIKALDSCTCLVPVITDSMFSEENTAYRNVFWFVVGYMQAKVTGGIVPYLAEGDGMALAPTPLKNANLVKSGTEMIKTLESKYFGHLMKSHYYDNYLLNYYALKRILYRRVTLKCRIYESDFKRVCEVMEYEWGDKAEKKLDRYLAQNLMCAYKVLSFGCENSLEPQFAPYREEIHPSENGLASSIICKSSYNELEDEDKAATGVHAEMDIEVIVPVHKLFGVYFKCYLGLEQKEYYWMLPLLFAKDIGKLELSETPTDDELEDVKYWNGLYPKNTYNDFKKARLYFSLGLERHNESKSLTLTDAMGVGSTADYIFPQ